MKLYLHSSKCKLITSFLVTLSEDHQIYFHFQIEHKQILISGWRSSKIFKAGSILMVIFQNFSD